MSQISYRGNLSAKTFPFISEFFGRSVIIPGPDQNFSRQLTSTEDPDKNIGVAQMYYGHNIMPSSEGFQSIGYTNQITSNRSGFSDTDTLRDVAGNEVFFSHADDGSNYVLPFGSSGWLKINTIVGTTGVEVSIATLNGQSYIYFAGVGCYMYSAASNTLVPIVLTGLDPTTLIGITSSFGYMIAWGANTIAWSSILEHAIPTDPIDFVPSLITGAGGGNVEAAKGKITICSEHYLGFIIYTTENAVAAVYSGNSKFPFNLRPIVNSGGLANKSLLTTDANSGNHYAYTSSGLQLISISATQTVYPEIIDFIAGEYFEDFDEGTYTFSSQILTSPMKKAINVISDRYLVISYGISSLTHALVYDLIYKRIGKLRIPHTKCFEWKLLTPEITETPRASIGFLQDNGSIQVVDFSYGSSTSVGCMILGKYQYVRPRLVQLQEIALENIRSADNFVLKDMVSLDGKTISSIETPTLAIKTANYREYKIRTTGINHSLLFLGGFYMVSLQLKFTVDGDR